MTLEQYLNRKFGSRKSSLACIVYMLKASFFASTFRKFWQQWNPLWSYFLTCYLYKPLNKITHQYLAIFLTFTVSGFLHDCVAMVLLQKIHFFLTPIFSLFGIMVIIEKTIGLRLTKIPRLIRPIYHITLISVCTGLIYYLQMIS